MDLPDPKELPDYYETIAKPVSLKQIEVCLHRMRPNVRAELTIQDRMIQRTYQTYQEFYDDLGLMCRNAMTYNEDESEVFKDAQHILEIMEGYRPSIEERIRNPTMPIARPRPSASTPARPDSSSFGQRPTQNFSTPNLNSFTSQSPQPYPGPSSSTATGNYLPPLPKGVVTDDIVASLERYPAYEQSAWAQSLPPMAMQLFRQLAAAHAAKKRGLPPPVVQAPTPTLADLPSSARPNGASTLPDRLAPPLPTIKYLDFAFSTAGSSDRSSAIRLHNMRGVVTHAVVLGSDTSELELTAYISDVPKSDSATAATPVEPLEAATMPEVSLRVNGLQGSLPKVIHSTTTTTAAGENGTAGGTGRPTGMRWTISVPPSRAETKIEVVATKPGALAETSAIFVSRQY